MRLKTLTLAGFKSFPERTRLDFGPGVSVVVGPNEMPGFKGERIMCSQCGEGINFRREIRRNGDVLCRACAGESYYQPL